MSSDKPTATATSASHYNDWPNTQGFDVRYQELEPKELSIIGTIPAYAAGVLFRNGLGPRDVDQTSSSGSSTTPVYRVSHWFDAFAQVHRFQIHPPTAEVPKVTVTHSSRLTCDGLVERIRRTGARSEFTFGAKRDPCMSLFQKVQAFWRPMPADSPSAIDISVSLTADFPGLSKTGEKAAGRVGASEDEARPKTLCNKTDSSRMQFLDPETLQPIGLVSQSVLHPELKGPLSAAHACVDPRTGDLYNYNLNFGGREGGVYKVFVVSAETGRTDVLATIRHAPAYLHSSFLTENYIILCVWTAYFSASGLAMLWHRNFVDALNDYDPSRKATWFVIDRKPGGRGVVATYESEGFFCFHSINAYEEERPSEGGESAKEEGRGAVDVVVDLCTYSSLDVLKRFYIENMLSDSPLAKPYSDPINDKAHAAFSRFRLPRVPLPSPGNEKAPPRPPPPRGQAVCEHRGAAGLGPELPSINGALATRRHRYVYGVTDSGKSTFLDGLAKLDTETWEVVRWSVHGHTASEPIFVADPEGGGAEDAGVLLSVVLDGTAGKSYLLVLDARTMTEVGRADVDGVVGFGFHGVYVSRG